MIILLVSLQVLRKMSNSVADNSYLYFSRPGILRVLLILINNSFFLWPLHRANNCKKIEIR